MTVSNCALCLLSCFGDGYETRFLIPHSYFTSSPPPPSCFVMISSRYKAATRSAWSVKSVQSLPVCGKEPEPILRPLRQTRNFYRRHRIHRAGRLCLQPPADDLMRSSLGHIP